MLSLPALDRNGKQKISLKKDMSGKLYFINYPHLYIQQNKFPNCLTSNEMNESIWYNRQGEMSKVFYR